MLDALVAVCNAAGGMFGRRLELVEYDAAATETVARVRAACEEVVALVGDVFVEQVAASLTAAGCGLRRDRAADGLDPTTPRSLEGLVAGAFVAAGDPARVVTIGPDDPLAVARRDETAAAISSHGVFEVVGDIAHRTDVVPDWDAVVAEAMALDAGQALVDGTCGDVVVPLSDAAARAGWQPVLVAGPMAYDAECSGAADPARLVVQIPFLPFEDGAAAPATAAHADLLDRSAAPRTGAALMAAAAFWRWAVDADACLAALGDAARTCGDPPPWSTGVWTAGGLHPRLSAGFGSTGCVVVLGLDGDGAFERRVPADTGYACAPELLAPVP